MIASSLAPYGRDRASLAGRTVLQIIPNLDAGGAERTTIDVAAALVRAGAPIPLNEARQGFGARGEAVRVRLF